MVLFEVVAAVLFIIMVNGKFVKSRLSGGMGNGESGDGMGRDKKGVG